MASNGPKSGKPAPVVAKAKPPLAPKAPVETVVPVAPKAVEAAVEEKPALVAPAAIEAAVVEAAQETVRHTVETVQSAADVAEAIVPEPIAPAVVAPTPDQKKEFRMTVDPKILFSEFNDRAKAAVEKSTRTVEEFNEFAKGNVEALVESGKITAKGFEALSHEAVEYSRKSFETATAAFKGLAAAKSPTDFFKLQSDFLRGAFDSYVAEASKATEAVIKLAGEAAQPISSRVALAAEKAKIAA